MQWQKNKNTKYDELANILALSSVTIKKFGDEKIIEVVRRKESTQLPSTKTRQKQSCCFRGCPVSMALVGKLGLPLKLTTNK